MRRHWSFMVGRTEFTNKERGLYISRFPKGQRMAWRVVVSREPQRLVFSERYGYAPKPRSWHVWPLHVTYYSPKAVHR